MLVFTGALIGQVYNLAMLLMLIVSDEYKFAFFFFMTNFSPGLFTMWQRYITDNKWNWKIFSLCCHPMNMIVWPIKTALNSNQYNKDLLEVASIMFKVFEKNLKIKHYILWKFSIVFTYLQECPHKKIKIFGSGKCTLLNKEFNSYLIEEVMVKALNFPNTL